MTHPHASLIERAKAVALAYEEYDEYVAAAIIREAIEALSAPITLAQAMQCPEVQAIVEAARKAETLLIATYGMLVTNDPPDPELFWDKVEPFSRALAPILALSANNPAADGADPATLVKGE